MTPGQSSPGYNSFRPNAAPAAGGFFGGGFGRGLLGGFLGAGLFGMLFGHGMFGGLGGGMSIIGLLIQVGLLFLLVRFAISFFRNRNQPGFAFNAPGQANAAGPQPGQPQGGFGQGGFGMPGFGAGLGGGNASAQRDRLQIQPDDFNAFEDKLAQVQAAYSREDYGALRQLVTPEMASYFSEQLAENARKGVHNKLGVPKLLAGDLAEAWSEQDSDYATVAMRFAMTDWMVERASEKVVAGDPNVAQEAAEVWTFVRPRGTSPADWKLSAIQQA